MSTRLSHFSNGIIEAGWLVALVVIPLHFNPASSRVFEPDKIALLRSIAVIMGLAWMVKVGEGWFARKGLQDEAPMPLPRAPGRALASHPLVLLVLFFLVSTVAATVLSVLPYVSLGGYYGRLYGLYTAAAYLVVFFSMLALLRTREQVQRLVTTTLLVSLPMALYGILQHLGADPLDLVGPEAGRVFSTMGNPIFLAAVLAMAVPLTLYRLWEARRGQRYVLLGCYLALLAVQLACMLFTQSRGPVMGLTVGLIFGGLLWTLSRHHWRAAKGIVGGSLALAVFLILVNLPHTPLLFVQDVPYLGRLTRVADVEGSAEGRVLIWEGAVDLMAADPARTMLGYGPETIRFAYYPYYTAEIGRIHGWEAFVDRTHNETFDVLVTTGLAGFLAYLLLFTGIVYYGLVWTGLIASPGQRNGFLALWFVGGTAAVLVLRWVGRTWAFSGVALPLGMLGGLFLYLAGYAFYASRNKSRVEEPAPPRGTGLLVILLLSGILAHFVEINVGIAVSATRLLFWVYTAVLIVLGWLLRRRPAPAAASGDDRVEAAGAAPVVGLLVGFMLATLAYSFAARGLWFEGAAGVWGVLGVTWLLAGLVVLLEARPVRRAPFTPAGLGVYAGLSVLPPGVFIGGHLAGIDDAHHQLLFYYLLALLVTGAAAFLVGRGGWQLTPKPTRPGVVLASVGTLAAIAFLYTTNVEVIRANIDHLRARTAYQQRHYDQAIHHYRRARARDPGQELYQLELAQLLATKAHYRSREVSERERLFQDAEQMLLQAAARNPFEQYHPAALGEVYRLWAKRTARAQGRLARYQQACAAFARAVHINPENVLVWTQWAETYEEMGDRTEAIEKYRQVLAWDTTNAALYLRLADLYRAEAQWRPAAAMYEGALRHSPRPLPAVHQALAVLYGRLERLQDAVRESERAVDLDPSMLVHHAVLIGLYERLGRCGEAQAQARAALRRWPGNDELQARAEALASQCPEHPDPG